MNVRFWKLSCYRPIFNKTVYHLYSFSSFAKAATNASILIDFAICQFIPAACVILIFPERVGHHTHNGNGCFFGVRDSGWIGWPFIHPYSASGYPSESGCIILPTIRQRGPSMAIFTNTRTSLKNQPAQCRLPFLDGIRDKCRYPSFLASHTQRRK